jgi:hypothetical protein
MPLSIERGGGTLRAVVCTVLVSCGSDGEPADDGVVCGLSPSGEMAGCVRIKEAVLFAGVEVGHLDVVDLDGDGDEDLLSEDGWMVLQERGELRVQRVPFLPPTWDQLQVGDVEGDGVPDVLLLTGGRVFAIPSPVDAPDSLRPLPFEDVGLLRATDLDGDGRSEIATVHFDVFKDDVEPPGPWNALEVWARDDDGEYSSVKDWRSIPDSEDATRMEVLHFEPEAMLDFLFLKETSVLVRPFAIEQHVGTAPMFLPYVWTKYYVLRDVLQRGRRIAVSITTPYPNSHDHHDVDVHDWRDGPTLSSPVHDEQIHGLATGNLVGDARHEVLVAVSRDDGRPYLDVKCIGNRDERQFEPCGSVALEHIPERLAVLELGDEEGATIVYAAEGKLYRMDTAPKVR